MTLRARTVKLGGVNQPTDPNEIARIVQRLVELKQEHRDLDAAIATLQSTLQADDLALKRLKKRKLQLKDCIARLELALIPDEPA
jgi:Uncharacterized conserved small protein containing a coiled-coil domain